MTNNKITLPYNFEPRWYQIPLMNAICGGKYKRAVVVWHRRAGKDKTLINITAVMSQMRVGSYYYFLPELKQAKKIVWDGIDREGFKFLNHFPDAIIEGKNEAELKIKFKNGSLFQLVGSDRFDSSMGTNPVGCVFSEFALQNPQGWNYIRPILRENGGWAIFNSTPRGKNHLYDLHMMAKDNPSWFGQILTVRDTKVLTEEEIQEERDAGMDEGLIQQEFYCSFSASTPGAYFAKEMSAADEQGRICGVPIETGIPVDTYWDLGIDDSTSIWFVQVTGREIRIVNHYENAGEGLSHYARILKEFADTHNIVYGCHVLPHDGKNRQLQTGKSTRDFLYDLGIKCDIAPRPRVKEDAIEAARQMIPRCWFDSKRCAQGIESLRQYRKEWDEINQVYKPRPLHDKNSHAADAFQTLALGFRQSSGLSGFTPRR